MIDTIIFDLGQVLVKVDWQHLLAEFQREFEITELELKNRIENGVYESFMIGKITPTQFHQLVCQHHRRNISLEKFKSIWNSMLAGPMPGMAEIVEQLVQRNYPLSLLSNTDPWHYEACVRQLPWLNHFGRKFLSYELQLKKPDAEIYLAVAEALAAKPEHCLFVDDRIENIMAAQALHFRTIHFSDASNFRQELERIGITV